MIAGKLDDLTPFLDPIRAAIANIADIESLFINNSHGQCGRCVHIPGKHIPVDHKICIFNRVGDQKRNIGFFGAGNIIDYGIDGELGCQPTVISTSDAIGNNRDNQVKTFGCAYFYKLSSVFILSPGITNNTADTS